MIRNHSVFIIQYATPFKRRIEDDLGELAGYGAEETVNRSATVVAPSQAVAVAWLRNRSDPRIIIGAISETPLDGFIQELTY